MKNKRFFFLLFFGKKEGAIMYKTIETKRNFTKFASLLPQV